MNTVAKIEPNQHPIEHYEIMEKVIGHGDLKRLSSKERLEYYDAVCKSIGLNPLTRPFEFVAFDGKITLYAKKDCTEQLRAKRKISIVKVEKEVIEGVFLFTAYAKAADGQEDVATGAVTIKGLTGKQLANAYKIAETQAKRRVTLSISGLGWTDASELPDVPNAEIVVVDPKTGEIEEKAIETPVEAVQTLSDEALDELANELTACNDLTSLKNLFSRYFRLHHNDSHVIDALTIAKDARKAELEVKAKETIEQFQREAAEVPDFLS